jgi:hypothetical protein
MFFERKKTVQVSNIRILNLPNEVLMMVYCLNVWINKSDSESPSSNFGRGIESVITNVFAFSKCLLCINLSSSFMY